MRADEAIKSISEKRMLLSKIGEIRRECRMVDAKYVNMSEINVGYDGERLINLSGIDIGFSMDEFQKILDERKQTLRALWLARARCAKAESNVCDLHNEYDEKHLWELVERKCMAKANEYK